MSLTGTGVSNELDDKMDSWLRISEGNEVQHSLPTRVVDSISF